MGRRKYCSYLAEGADAPTTAGGHIRPDQQLAATKVWIPSCSVILNIMKLRD